MFDTKKDDQQPHVLHPIGNDTGADRGEPHFEPAMGDAQSTPEQSFNELAPKSAPVDPMNFGQKMAQGTNRSDGGSASGENLERTAAEPAQAELTRAVDEAVGANDTAQAVLVEPVRSDAGESESFGEKTGSPAFSQPPDEPMQKDDTPQYGLPVDTSKSSPRIGAILVANGKMTEQDVAAVLDLQEREPSIRFGELAVRAGYVTKKDVDDALAAQFGFSSSSQVSHGLPPEIVTAHTPFSPFAEALRGLRSQLMLRWFDGSPQQCALAVTSVDRADGKSFICSNLGVIFSQLGEKTLIIDADLRNSTQHLKFGLHNKMGLSGVLSGRAGVEEILAVPGVNNLALLPAGPIPPNPQELLGREDFSRFLAAMSNTFDVILIDTPSAQQASDAQVVAQRARAAVIVGRKDKTKSSEIGQLGAVMTSAGVKLLGATLNEY